MAEPERMSRTIKKNYKKKKVAGTGSKADGARARRHRSQYGLDRRRGKRGKKEPKKKRKKEKGLDERLHECTSGTWQRQTDAGYQMPRSTRESTIFPGLQARLCMQQTVSSNPISTAAANLLP
ncbi:hypothetical protein MAPG_09705 [Magnaporthiopsis poae ATCC 64411]|uniref:Uncharacterized protein n=1 Tax=Magnaporthiopsis poae (strain ATCC 64411 / 73-15) TaxID=644358 RepID=A0A0C4EAM9_MAGP6|nr:hypothetical protein MAPG_09705 [Magnaporthiopsis poae ATCC 64411]